MEDHTSDDHHSSNEDEPNMKGSKRASEEANEDQGQNQHTSDDNRSRNENTLKKRRKGPEATSPVHEIRSSSSPPKSRVRHSRRSSRAQDGNPYFLKTSSRNPENPYQDSTDSELDEIESDIELEMALKEALDRKQKPHLKLVQEGYVCNYCGVLIPYEQWKPSYPQVYICQDCKESLDDAKTPGSALQEYRNRLQRETFALRLDHARSPTYPKSAKSDRPSEGESSGQDAQEESSRDRLVAGGMIWTAEEGDLFFHGLRRFGKHNIWAIKDHVKTRTLAEIVTMIQAMEAELGRRRHFGMEVVPLKDMPMATESTEDEIRIEECHAHKLLQEENKNRWAEISQEPDETQYKLVEKSQLFNLRTLSDLSSRLYIQNENAGIERDVVYELHDALVAWLKPLIKELAMMNHEQNRIGDVIQQTESDKPKCCEPVTELQIARALVFREYPGNTDRFFRNLPQRLGLLEFDDSPAAMKKETAGMVVPSPVWTFDGFGKKYYLNEQVDSAQAQAPDSDQDEETDDGVEAEEEIESTLECPLPFIPSTEATVSSSDKADEVTEAYFKKRELEEAAWDMFWSTRAGRARQIPKVRSTIVHKRFRETQPHPNLPEQQTFEQWSEGVERLSANSHSLPIATAGDNRDTRTSLRKKKDDLQAPIQSINKRIRSHEQQLYMPGYVVPKGTWPRHVPRADVDSSWSKNLIRGVGVKKDLERQKRMELLVKRMVQDYEKDGQHADSVFQENYAPGYGYLPHNASHSTDPTRAPPKSGFGLGQRRHAGLWTGDETLSGYITVSDTEDEEEEERGWRRQMLAEQKIEDARSAFDNEEEDL
ncbi:hypothetical protein BGZ82_000782 [Podila clonocystis]|nr:hypothetical protein BGZ82_000782 [Podila clonocystis]